MQVVWEVVPLCMQISASKWSPTEKETAGIEESDISWTVTVHVVNVPQLVLQENENSQNPNIYTQQGTNQPLKAACPVWGSLCPSFFLKAASVSERGTVF